MIEQYPPIEWDEDGYPTEASLAALRAVDNMAFVPGEAERYLRQELAQCAERCCASYEEEPAVNIVDKPVLHLRFSTGGWSGAESLMAELLRKFWIDHLLAQWNRGGHYIFEVPLP